MAQSYVATRRRRLISLFLGSGVGGAISFGLAMMIPGLWSALLDESQTVAVALLVFLILALAWLLGIGLFALPVWRQVERKRTCNWRTAAICGGALGLLAFLGGIVIWQVVEFSTGAQPELFRLNGLRVAEGAVLAAAASCVVALAMWRYAYRTKPPTEIADAFN